MFAFDRSAMAVLAPLALLAVAVAVSNYSADSQPRTAQSEGQQERSGDPQRGEIIFARAEQAPTKH